VKGRPPKIAIAVPIVLVLAGIGLSIGAVLSYNDQHSGEPGKAKVTSCTGKTGRYSTGLHCTGTWISGGSLLEGGHVVIGEIVNGDRGDVGKTIDVRVHGSDHATKPNLRVSIILALLGGPMAVFGLYLLFTSLSRSRTAPTSESASS
jgi:hypothetical protein